MPGNRAGDLQPQQPTSNTNYVGRMIIGLDNAVGIFQRAQGHHTGQILPWNGWNKGAGAICQDELFIVKNASIVHSDQFRICIDIGDTHAEQKIDMVFEIPILFMQIELVSFQFTSQVTGQVHSKIG